MWEYLRALEYNNILKKYAHTPTEYLKNIKKVKKDTLELATVVGMEPSELMKKDYFVRSFHESDLEDEVGDDLFGIILLRSIRINWIAGTVSYIATFVLVILGLAD